MTTLEKGRTRKQVKAKRQRTEHQVMQAVRAACMERDGELCRAAAWRGIVGVCSSYGELEWAHLGEWKRFKTRGMAPDERHHTRGSLMLCALHHQMYDAGKFDIEYGPDGADGPLIVVGARP